MQGNSEKKDTVEKEFVAFPDVAADTINALLYQGKIRTGPQRLWPRPTETVYQGNEKLRTQYEDLCKFEIINGQIRIMYLIANQSRADGKMLLRKAGYTGGIYREQSEKKTQSLFPVIELILYRGQPGWKSGRDIRQLFRRQMLEKEEWKYIDDLKLHVFEMRRLPPETRNLFRSDMRIVVDFLAEGIGYRSDQKIVHKAALLKMLKVLSGETDTENIEKWLEQQHIREEDEITVCELFDQYERKGRKEGLVEGIKCGEARRLVVDIENAMKFFQVTLERACEALGTTVSKYEEARKLI